MATADANPTGAGSGNPSGRPGGDGTGRLIGGGGISLPAIERLRGRENYSSWAFATKMLLIREGTWDAVNAPQEGDPENEKSLRALATICLSIEPINYSLVQSATTAKQAWDKLKKAFQDDGMTRRIGLLRKLTSVRLGDFTTVEAYVNELMSTSHKLSEAGFKIDDVWLASLLLMGLPEVYEPMIMGLEASGAKITADAVKAKILQDVKVPSECSSNGHDGAFYSQQREGSFNKSGVKCYRCKCLGHYAAECPAKEERNGRSGKHAAFTVTQSSIKREVSWIFDSGATSHMCNNGITLEDAKEVRQRISVANNAVSEVDTVGRVRIDVDVEDDTCDVALSNVLRIPDLAMNLISVSKICSNGYSVTFSKNACEVRSASNEVVAFGRENEGLYQLCVASEDAPILDDEEVQSCVAGCRDDVSPLRA